jgi:hypothetical protein
MPVDQITAYRIMYETASFELIVLRGAIKKLQQEEDRGETVVTSKSAVTARQPSDACSWLG